MNAIRQYVDEIRGFKPVFLLFTHSDYDHIMGYKAIDADRVFTSEAMSLHPEKVKILEQAQSFDHQFYIERPYPLEYPQADFAVYRDGVQFRTGQTKMTFYLTPGHTVDSMMVVIWHLGLCIAGDYLSDVEFPFIKYSSIDYEQTLEKLPRIHDKNWFTRLIPGHGTPALTINDWLRRRTESLTYLFAIRESISTDVPFDETSLWQRYRFPLYQRQCHNDNLALMRKEFDQGLWSWDPAMHLDFDLPLSSHKGSGEDEQ